MSTKNTTNVNITKLVDNYWNASKEDWMCFTTKLKDQGLRQVKVSDDQKTPASLPLIPSVSDHQISTSATSGISLGYDKEIEAIIFDVGYDKMEPMLRQNEEYIDYMNPTKLDIKFNKAYDLQFESLWLPTQIRSYHIDKASYEKAPSGLRFAIEGIAAFFKEIDNIVGDTVYYLRQQVSRHCAEFYSIQEFVETIHNKFYNQYPNEVFDMNSFRQLLKDLIGSSAIQSMTKFAKKWQEPGIAFRFRVAQQLITEKLFFCGPFTFIFYLKNAKQNFPALVEGNSYVSKDEAQHVDAAMLQLVNLAHPVEEKVFAVMVEDAMNAIDLFTEFYLSKMQNHNIMNAANMKKFNRFMANVIAEQLGFSPIYKQVSNPFPFVQENELITKQNFFEVNGVDYAALGKLA